MVSKSLRDPARLQRKDLLDDYWSIAQRRSDALVSTALRTRSTDMRDILTHGATNITSCCDELQELVLTDALNIDDITDIKALADLGRLVLLQNILEKDAVFGEKLLQFSLTHSNNKKLSKKNALVLAQHLIVSGAIAEAREVLDAHKGIDSDYFNYLEAELDNPFTVGTDETFEVWLSQFNRMFTFYGLAPIYLEDSDLLPFDRIRSVVDQPAEGPPVLDESLVSVVLTAYKPDQNSLLNSVRSILNQTWTNLELIIVDDASGPEFDELFEKISALDKRVRIIRSTTNRGTYISRNIGYAAAQGEFITGQDDDDWSHPERVARQVQYLAQHPESIGCRVTAVRCNENLGRVRPGYPPLGENASSLLIRREGYEAAGDFLEARKAADTEYYYRVQEATGRPVGRVRAPLSIIRILPDSLSRSDFSPGWKHSSRRSFRSSYELWHRTSSPKELRVSETATPPVKVPRRFMASREKSSRDELDVVFAGVWEKFGGPQKSMLEEIRALRKAGYRVGVLNLEAARFMSKEIQASLVPEIQKLINEGTVDEIHYDDDVEIRLLILRYPPILQFFTADASKLSINSMIIVANQAPSELDGRDIRYLVDDCHKTARKAFGVEPIWVPQGPQVRHFISRYIEAPILADFDLPGIIDVDSWWQERWGYRSITPVVGRHSRDDPMKWPESRKTLSAIYPIDGSYDVRIMGGVKTPLKVLGTSLLSTGWTVYKRDELSVLNFLSSLDYFVFYQHSQAVEAFGRAILEALASGTVVILPKSFSDVFGEAALYAEPEDVSVLIHTLHSDFSVYRSQLGKARAILEARFSYQSYVDKIKAFLFDRQYEELT